MLATSIDNGSGNPLDVVTDLDLSALVDLGWEISIPTPQLTPVTLSPSEATLSWPSTSFCSYEVRKSTNLLNYNEGSGIIEGTGSVLTWTDPSPSPSAFFEFQEVLTGGISSRSAGNSVASTVVSEPEYQTYEVAPRVVEGCGCDSHHHDEEAHE